jgi:hypothetical protein
MKASIGYKYGVDFISSTSAARAIFFHGSTHSSNVCKNCGVSNALANNRIQDDGLKEGEAERIGCKEQTRPMMGTY